MAEVEGDQIILDFAENGGKRSFENHHDLDNWLMSQKSAWRFEGIESPLDKNIFAKNVVNRNDQVFQRWSDRFNQALQTSGDNLSDSSVSEILEEIERGVSNKQVVLVDSPLGKYIFQIAQRHGKGAGYGALGQAMRGCVNGENWSQFINATDSVLGMVLASLFEKEVILDTEKAYEEALKSVYTDFSEKLVEQTAVFEQNQRQFNAHLDEYRKLNSESTDQLKQHYKELYNQLAGKAEQAIASIKQTEEVYINHMQLEAPVEYWNAKAIEHRKEEGNYRKILIKFAIGAVLAVLGIGSSLIWYLNHIFNVISSESYAPAILGGSLFIFIVTAFVWIARIIVRLYLSEHHLAIDADQRMTMAKTYLALTKESAADEKTMPLVIEALFRQTSDGIVKDDAAPNFTLPEYLTGR